MRCFKCRKGIGFFELFGDLLKPFKHFCQICYYEKTLAEAEENVRYWKKVVKIAKFTKAVEKG